LLVMRRACRWRSCGPHLQGSRFASRDAADVDARLRTPRRPHADARLPANARGRDGGVREELAAPPGGNVTGMSNQASDLDAKRLELLREVVPNLHSLAIMANVGYPAAVLEMGAIKTNARKLGLDVTTIEIRRIEDIASGITALKGHVEALYVVTDPLVASNRIAINTLALDARLPTMHSVRDNVETGGLICYGPNYPDLFRRAADYVNKILRGAKPGDIPVEQPPKFDLVINLTTAKALGLQIPDRLLAIADEVIE